MASTPPHRERAVDCPSVGNADNLWVTGADGSNSVAIADFETSDISDIKWSLDGANVLFRHGEVNQNVVLIQNLRWA